MLNHITWQQYLITVGLLSTAYYLFILARYYASGIGVKGFKGDHGATYAYNKEMRAGAGEADVEEERSSFFTGQDAEDEFADVEDLIGRLKTVIGEASNIDGDKDDLKRYIGLTLQEYPAVKNSPLRSSVNELIESECQKYGAVSLGQDEVDLLWDTE